MNVHERKKRRNHERRKPNIAPNPRAPNGHCLTMLLCRGARIRFKRLTPPGDQRGRQAPAQRPDGPLSASRGEIAPPRGRGYAARVEGGPDRGQDPGELYTVEQAGRVLERTLGRVRQLLRSGHLKGEHEDGDASKPWRVYAWSVHAYRDATRGGARERREGTAATSPRAPRESPERGPDMLRVVQDLQSSAGSKRKHPGTPGSGKRAPVWGLGNASSCKPRKQPLWRRPKRTPCTSRRGSRKHPHARDPKQSE